MLRKQVNEVNGGGNTQEEHKQLQPKVIAERGARNCLPKTPESQQHSRGWGSAEILLNTELSGMDLLPSPHIPMPSAARRRIFPEAKTGHLGDNRHRGYGKVLR